MDPKVNNPIYNHNFDRIAAAIAFIQKNFQKQPDLEEIAANVNLGPHHFQRIFTDWAGVSPKKFLQYISLEYAKDLLREKQATLFDVALETGLSGTGRLHDLFITMEGMTPGEYKNGGSGLRINYHFHHSPFGKVIVASTPKGICHLAFTDKDTDGFLALKSRFPNAHYEEKTDSNQRQALSIFNRDWNDLKQVKLHLKGTDFQFKVWKSLLEIPFGGLMTYRQIAGKINNVSASRAVGTAIGSNPVAYLIPCHRVILSSGKTGEYMWGSIRKTAMIGWEAASTKGENDDFIQS